jgi:tRNA dimethylallyltransferase
MVYKYDLPREQCLLSESAARWGPGALTLTPTKDTYEVKPPQGESQRSFPPVIDRVIVLTGATATGKSDVALQLAQQIGGEVLSLDSIAVYRGMDIGTAKPDADARRRIPHHLIDLVDPSEEFSVARYLEAAHQKIAQIESSGRRAIFVGGTPMFLKGILRGFDPGPPADWDFRESVESDVRNHGIEALRDRLRQVDPLAAHRIGPNDTRRMIRALEVARHTGIPLSHRQTHFEQCRDAESCHVFALQWPRDQLHSRINRRVQQMFDDGLVDEVRALLTEYGELSRTASQAVGYREVLDWIAQRGDLDTLIESVSAHTRQLARRQETWFRSFSEIRTVPISDSFNPSEIAAAIASQA